MFHVLIDGREVGCDRADEVLALLAETPRRLVAALVPLDGAGCQGLGASAAVLALLKNVGRVPRRSLIDALCKRIRTKGDARSVLRNTIRQLVSAGKLTAHGDDVQISEGGSSDGRRPSD